jgi:hypothetical protein
MAHGTVLELENVLSPERKASEIAKMFRTWDMAKEDTKRAWLEVRNYLFATDTSTTSNKSLPWKNSTTTPKLTQIRDNLQANYMATIFPKRRFVKWEAGSQAAATKEKRKLLEDYTFSLVNHPEFKNTIEQLVNDFIDTGNCFVMPDWRDESVETEISIKPGYKGPVAKRISPYDIVFNPTAATFRDTPKIIRSLESIGDLENVLTAWSKDSSQAEVAKNTLSYLKDIRKTAYGVDSFKEKDEAYRVDGFESYHAYLNSGTVELLYFYGDYYDPEEQKLYKNKKIVVADRHRIVFEGDIPHLIAKAPIFHVGWRKRPDNLWSMGPLDNLVGLQYRIDHVENLKADVFDLIAAPVIKIKGYVEQFDWKPFGKIVVDADGDVEVLAPDAQALNANLEISVLEQKMEEMAGAPKEAMGFRTPGEKTMYEVQRLENAASRIFQSKISLFEEQLLEPLLNSMILLARQYGVEDQIKVIDPEFGAELWVSVTTEDLALPGRIRPVTARHFAEKAQLVQNINNFFGSAAGQDPSIKRHFSGFKVAKMFEELLEIEDWELVEQNIAISEETEATKLASQAQEDVFAMQQSPSIYEPPDQMPNEQIPA